MTLIRQTCAVLRRLALLALTTAAGCADDPISTSPHGPAPTLNPVSVVATPGDTTRIRVSAPAGARLTALTYAVSGPAVTVDAAGLVTAVAPGTAIVTVTMAYSGQTLTASVPVTVLGITLDPSRATLAVGGTVTLRPTLLGPAGSHGTLRWTSSDTTVAVVGPDGAVRGVAPGVARIAAVASASPRVRAESEVTVAATGGFPISVTVTPSTITLPTGGTQQLTASVSRPVGAPVAMGDVRFSSSDTSVATVSATGLVTARRNGMAVIRAAAAVAPTVWQDVAVTVRDPGRGRFTIQSVTTGDPPVPADLNAVRGRLRVAMSLPEDLGVVHRAELWLAGRRAAVRDSVPRATGGVATLTLDVDTDARDPQTGARLYPNGPAVLEVRLAFTAPGGTGTQGASIPLQLTLANP